ncbi:cobyric acid synthase [Nisaea acidiphila]|uniref:Cobyric acid synthase n=1 Tax=Nisaea acidiphila TaxID=1862145 RepID=A0A9J7AKV4_9PROT|nr:cobyric acid synthase [Nisaea acidiphila]UUX48283.1 cobyric acid synthase [Nisaea acidiphila]
MTAKTLMFQGTGSDVGKSVLVAGLCRVAARGGLRVRPFKPQNMSNNAAVTVDGGEIGRAQALQARAAGIEPHTDMNPVLLKPETDLGAQVVVQGQVRGHAKARAYQAMKGDLLDAVRESYDRLRADADLVLVEGAGSPAEVNLRAGDIANMGFAEATGCPVVLIGDIDRGGVIASLVGTHAVIAPSDRERIAAFLINKFRGDISLFDDGLRIVESHTGWPSLGVVPYFPEARKLPAEDAVALEQAVRADAGLIKIAVPQLSRIANFDDLDPLRLEPEVTVDIVEPGRCLPGDAALILIPGSKSTIGDLTDLRRQGWDIDIAAHVRRGGRVLGICGGYQMLGRKVHDPDGLEGPPGSADGLGFLAVETVLTPQKALTRISGRSSGGSELSGYEIHIGRTDGPDTARPFAWIDGGSGPHADGAASPDGRIAGSYLHGMFTSDAFRRAYLKELGARQFSGTNFEVEIDTVLDRLADHLEAHIDTARLFALAR